MWTESERFQGRGVRNHCGLPRYLFQIFTLHVLGLATPDVQIQAGFENLVRINMRCQEGGPPAAGQSFLVVMILRWGDTPVPFLWLALSHLTC